MKLRTLLLTALLGLGALAPLNTANAGHTCERTRVTYDCHGCPIYWAYRVVSYDCHGCPVYAWVRTGGGSYSSGGSGHSHGYSGSSSHGYGYSGSGYRSHDSCRSDSRFSIGRGGFRLSFGR